MNKKGFTFVEILAVIVLIGILSGLAIVGVSRYRENAKNKDYEALAKSSYNAMQEYMMSNQYEEGVSLETLEDLHLISNRKDPGTKENDCEGSVVVDKNNNTNGELDDGVYTVYLCCTNYMKKYTYPGGKVKDMTSSEKTTKCNYIAPPSTPEPDIPPTPGTTTYKLKYNDNGGTGCSTKSITREKDKAWGSLCTPTRTGYTFKGWKSGSTTITSSSKATANITVTAQWSPKTIVVTFNCNGGTGGGNQTFTYGVSGQKFNKTCTKSNKVLGGWNKTTSGSSATYSITNGVSNSWINTNSPKITLYAYWTDKIYTCTAGNYLPKGKTSCAKCTAGNYCLGGKWAYNASKDQGLTSCPNCYKKSAVGSSKISNCYDVVAANKYVKTANQCPISCPTGYERLNNQIVYYGKTNSCTKKNYKVHIRYNVNGAKKISPSSSAYTINNNILYKNGSILDNAYDGGGKIGESGLINYNNGEALNVNKDYYHIDNSKVWYKLVNGKKTYYNQTTQYNASDFCDASSSDCTVTLYLEWVPNTCIVTYSSNGGKFYNRNGSSVTAYTVDSKTYSYGDTLGTDSNGIRDARGSGGYYYAKRSGYVVAYGTEWVISGTSNKLNQKNNYNLEQICTSLKTKASSSAKLEVSWLDNKKTFAIYDFHHVASEDDCDYDSSKTELHKSHPYRQYRYYSYLCTCNYNASNSKLSAEVYYKRHNEDSRCTELYYKNTSNLWEQRCDKNGEEIKYKDSNGNVKTYVCGTTNYKCFSNSARIFYTANSKGVAACKGNGYKDNEYVYRSCSNGKVAEAGKSQLWHHGIYWYSGRSSKDSLIEDYWLTSVESFRNNNKLQTKTSRTTSKYNADSRSYNNNPNSDLNKVCKNYCIEGWGEYRNEGKNATDSPSDD